MNVMEFDSTYINYHHLNLLCDRMTMNTEMIPIFRSGLLNDDIGPIAKATFEVHTEVLLNASRHAQFDHMRGVSSSVMCGQYGNYGTGAFNVLLDMDEMSKLSEVQIIPKTDIEKMFELHKESNDVCSTDTISLQNNITNLNIIEDKSNVCDDDYNMGF